ncbi:serine/threonine-protein kinase [Streptomyces sp. VRA16 Mangrove soil]|uniref:serine/threonine-protein kinase n=1 Tax=Streptomyces sp. VRA16 Mangrove soil TaxID=2817434 RepID=UPI001A9EE4DF|nr:serine/threonine-protein kinase [Streptomyces sp. VRA16 Mangrove soil]MBO1337223.1 protein kinase [Streptomyces sp. VRA16 Mangrove soil]
MRETQPGTVVGGRFRLDEVLARGGFGIVWKARDLELKVGVAVKEVYLPPATSPEEHADRLARARREARNAAALRDEPYIVAVHDMVTEDDRPWMVMRLVEGHSLERHLADRGPLPAQEATRAARCLLKALAAAHTAGIVHRDVKPANVMVADGGDFLLTDFGIAVHSTDTSLTSTGMLIGSLEYVAPERAGGGEDRPAGDLFSLGATLYQAVEGVSPFRRAHPTATLTALLTEPAPEPEHAGRLAPLITGLLEKDPDRRPTVEEALRLLDAPPPSTRTITEPATVPTPRPAKKTPAKPPKTSDEAKTPKTSDTAKTPKTSDTAKTPKATGKARSAEAAATTKADASKASASSATTKAAPSKPSASKPSASKPSASSAATKAAVSTACEATDAARARAADKGVDLALVTGTGQGGRITVQDVYAAEGKRATKQPASTSSTGLGCFFLCLVGVAIVVALLVQHEQKQNDAQSSTGASAIGTPTYAPFTDDPDIGAPEADVTTEATRDPACGEAIDAIQTQMDLMPSPMTTGNVSVFADRFRDMAGALDTAEQHASDPDVASAVRALAADARANADAYESVSDDNTPTDAMQGDLDALSTACAASAG